MDRKPEEKKGQHQKVRLALAALLAVLLAALPASALTINMSGILVVLTNVSGTILPMLLDVVVASLPIIVTLAIIGFIVGFLDKILDMIKLK